MLWQYFSAFLHHAGYRAPLAFLLMLAAGASESAGLLMLVPLLQFSGLTPVADGEPGLAAELLNRAAGALGVTFTLPLLLALFLVLVVTRALLSLWRDLYLARLRLEYVDHWKKTLHAAVGNASWIFLSRQKSSDINHILNSDIDRIGIGTYYFLSFALTVLLIAGHAAIALMLSPPITLLALCCGGLLVFLMRFFLRRARQLGQTLTEDDRQVFGSVSEFLNGIKLAKSYTAEPAHHRHFVEATDRLRATQLKYTRQSGQLRAFFQIGAAFLLSILLYLALTVAQMPSAQLLVLVLIFSRLLPMLSQLQSHAQEIAHMLPAFVTARRFLAACEAAAEPTPSRPDTPAPSLHRALSLRQVSFVYPQQRADTGSCPDAAQSESVTGAAPPPVVARRPAVDGVPAPVLERLDLTIPADRTTALVGPSGAGKSTLADLLLGLLTPTAGTLTIDDEPLTADRLRAWRGRAAYVPQDTFLFHESVRANLLWACPDADQDRLRQVLELVSAAEFVAALPDGLDTVVGERGIRLSGGERQRLALARALLRRPQLLVLDEATSALDHENERRIQQAIEALHGEMTIVVIAHRLSTVRHADQIVVIDSGRIVETGTWESLTENRGGRLHALLRAAAVS